MTERSWVHFACHAKQDKVDPRASGFLLHDRTLDLAMITKKPLRYAEFAFLSACQTASGDESILEEAVHLAAGMLMAGYSSVIATMWSVQDDHAPLVAEQVYAHMLKDGVPHSRKAAVALHKAVRTLRDKIGEKDFVSSGENGSRLEQGTHGVSNLSTFEQGEDGTHHIWTAHGD
ncbi:CHAT domain protein [Ceratobasidium sp. AG-Ba]|nr:CHAT domain protein [Ceratobasidium sp. AG-Ba]